jgi:AcrR family transcriptional regulator
VNLGPDIIEHATRRQRWDAAESFEDRRDEILKALGAVIQERGVSGLTMEVIADRLGLVKGNLYYYFKSKRDLIYHCHLKCMRTSLAALEQIEGDEEPAALKLRMLLIRHIRGIIEEGYGAVLLSDIEFLSSAQRQEYVAMRDRFERGVRVLIARGIEEGDFRDQDVKLAGFVALGAINWIPAWYRADGELPSAEIAEGVADFCLRGLR